MSILLSLLRIDVQNLSSFRFWGMDTVNLRANMRAPAAHEDINRWQMKGRWRKRLDSLMFFGSQFGEAWVGLSMFNWKGRGGQPNMHIWMCTSATFPVQFQIAGQGRP